MPHHQLDRHALKFAPLATRQDRVFIEEDHVAPDARPRAFAPHEQAVVEEAVGRIRTAREAGKSRMLTFGAHAIKNGLAPIFIQLIEEGWVTHLATNGAGIIHDWEFSFQGHSSEHVQQNVSQGLFGMWQETGYYLNLALVVGAWRGLGYGESIGAMVAEEKVTVPTESELLQSIRDHAASDPAQAAAAADLLERVRACAVEPGEVAVPHPYKQYGLQAAAYRLGVPFTAHPMIGHDIIYLHPLNCGAAIGRTAERDFLAFAQGVQQLDGGVYMSIGSAVMSPMVFEKSMSMAQNLAIQTNQHLDNHLMVIVDLQESKWDWMQGEPPEDNPDYYLRYNKSFSRMGGTMRYLCADNRDFLLAIYHGLNKSA